MAVYVMTSPENVHLVFDSDADETDRAFIVDHGTGGPGNQLLLVSEAGEITVFGALGNQTPVGFQNFTGADDVALFKSGSTVKAKITASGTGVFFGLRLPRNTDPNSPDLQRLVGETGDLLLWNQNGMAQDELWFCYNGALSRWNKAITA